MIIQKGLKDIRFVKFPKPTFAPTPLTGGLIALTNEYISEDQLIDLLDIDIHILRKLRYFYGLPYVPVFKGLRVYRVAGLLGWLDGKEIIAGQRIEEYEFAD